MQNPELKLIQQKAIDAFGAARNKRAYQQYVKEMAYGLQGLEAVTISGADLAVFLCGLLAEDIVIPRRRVLCNTTRELLEKLV
jgi:hypothetical protein